MYTLLAELRLPPPITQEHKITPETTRRERKSRENHENNKIV